MNIQNMSQLITSNQQNNWQNTQQAGANQQNSALFDGIPAEAFTGAPLNGSTDFGPASAYVPGEQAPTPQAQTFTPDMERVGEMWDRHQQQVDSFRRMVETLFNQQAERQGLADGWSIRDIEITDEMRAEAEDMLSEEGGYFSVSAVATRILDFAVALTGGDPGRIDLMRDAVQRGFDQAERMFGGELPEITQETHAAVMEGFDQWAEAGSSAAITLLQQQGV